MSEKNKKKPIPTSLNFDEELVREVPVVYKGKHYVFREPTLDAARKSSNLLSKNQVVNDQGKVVKVDNVGDIPMHIVSGSLFEKLEDGKERQVPINEVITWPSRYVLQLMQVYQAWEDSNKSEEGEDKEGDDKDKSAEQLEQTAKN